jgi:hypothetical protein
MLGQGLNSGQENSIAHVTLYKPSGEIVLSVDVKKYEQEGAALVLYLEGEKAEYYGPKVITTLPYFIGSKTQS